MVSKEKWWKNGVASISGMSYRPLRNRLPRPLGLTLGTFARLDSPCRSDHNSGHYGATAALLLDLRPRGEEAPRGHLGQAPRPHPSEDRGAVAVRAECRDQEPQARPPAGTPGCGMGDPLRSGQ